MSEGLDSRSISVLSVVKNVGLIAGGLLREGESSIGCIRSHLDRHWAWIRVVMIGDFNPSQAVE